MSFVLLPSDLKGRKYPVKSISLFHRQIPWFHPYFGWEHRTGFVNHRVRFIFTSRQHVRIVRVTLSFIVC